MKVKTCIAGIIVIILSVLLSAALNSHFDTNDTSESTVEPISLDSAQSSDSRYLIDQIPENPQDYEYCLTIGSDISTHVIYLTPDKTTRYTRNGIYITHLEITDPPLTITCQNGNCVIYENSNLIFSADSYILECTRYMHRNNSNIE